MPTKNERRVAVIGCSFRFPSTDLDHYWNDLLDGKDLVSVVDSRRWLSDRFLHPSKSNPGTAYTFAAGSLGDISGFDAAFFGISPREAAQMDPQQRLLLELAWESLENAGVKPSTLRGSDCGVFMGVACTDYSMRFTNDLAAIDSSVATGTTGSIAANRLSYFFDLRGPSMAIDTACSSSLVAFHQACRSILSGEVSHALAGGVSLHLHPYGFVIFSKASMLSRRGRCSAFDAAGDGYVRSEGGGVFLLKDYDTAIADGDRILAVVAHTAINTDGRKTGLTVPRAEAQADLLSSAYRAAGIAPETIDYIEAHGTGTAVGDPIEAQALGIALGQKRPSGKPLLIGSVKSNLGHLEAAAGVAGVVKAIYSIRHRVVPATIGIQTLNPHIHFDDLNLEVVTTNTPLPPSGTITIGVNSFGFGGANAHVILESPAEPAKLSKPGAGQLKPLPLIISAATPAALKAVAGSFAEYLHTQAAHNLYDIAYHAIHRRDWLGQRAVIWGSSPKTMAAALREFSHANTDELITAESPVHTGSINAETSAPAFVYTGNGSQWLGMGRALLKEPVFRTAIRAVDALFQRHANYSLENELAGKNGEGRFEYTEIAQPTLFAIQVGVTELLRDLGIHPAATVGHSVGEVAAAWAAGAITLETAVHLIFQRSRIQGKTKGKGQMTAVALDVASMHALLQAAGLDDQICIAGINSPRAVTLAGPTHALETIEAALLSQGTAHKRLDIDYAFHSPAMDSSAIGIMEALADLTTQATQIPFYSTVSGNQESGETLGAVYWWHNVRKPVMFEAAINNMIAAGIRTFVEIGPHPVLRSYLRDCLQSAGLEGHIIPTLKRDNDDPHQVLAAASRVLIAGAKTAWDDLFPFVGNFVDLPNYAWQRETHWHSSTTEASAHLNRDKQHPLLGFRLSLQAPTWENQLDTQMYPVLADHVVGEGVVFPGTAYVELALAAAQQWRPGSHMGIEELEIRAPLLLSSDNARIVRFAIDPADGSFAINAREHTGNGEWTLHATGRILQEPGASLLQNRMPALPLRSADFNARSHASMTRAAGLAYGPAFKAIEEGWLENGMAFAHFQIPAELATEIDQYLLHPALLDCAFQLIIQLMRDDAAPSEGVAFVPVKIGRIAMATNQGQAHFARAELLRHSPHSLLADFTLFDADGAALAYIKNVRFRSIRLHKNKSGSIHQLEYHAIPQPLTGKSEAACLPFESIRHHIKEAVRRVVMKGAHHRYAEEVDPLLDELCSHFALEALGTLCHNDWSQLDSALQQLRSGHPEQAPFIDYLVQLTEADSLLSKDNDGWRLLRNSDETTTAQDIWNTLLGDYPDYSQIIHAVGRVGVQLPALLNGTRQHAEALPAESSLASLGQQILGAGGKNHVGQALRNVIAEGLRQLPAGQRFNVMEICGDAPSYAFDLCVALDFDRGDFCFATHSLTAQNEAHSLRTKFPALRTQLINETSLRHDAENYHLAVISIDFNNAASAILALKHAKAHLAPSGTLLILGHYPARWIDFVFGGQHGWWSKTNDGDHASQQQSLRLWQHQLEQLGFDENAVLEFSPDTGNAAYILLAQKPGRASIASHGLHATARHWLLLSEATGPSAEMAETLAHKLSAHGDHASSIVATSQTQLETALQEIQTRHGKADGIVYLSGLGSTADLIEAQTQRCTGLAELVRACENTHVAAPCWLVTANAMSKLLPESGTANKVFADAALWGFGRSLMNESSSLDIRLIDLADITAIDICSTALQHELERPDTEDEVIIASSGARFVPRLKPRPQSQPRPSAEAEKPFMVRRLSLEAPGQLRNLRWEEHAGRSITDEEIEVEVRATGLNFRDVMYALGLLSDEAIEDGFAGPTLGLEFAGTVLSVGSKIKDYVPGDQVMGFGPSSFSTRVITQADALAHIPPGVSFSAAATIPSTFFTAYYALHHLSRLSAGERVLIHGAAGGVGIAAIQVAKWCGAEIFATAGSDEKRDFLHLLGVDHILDSRSLAYADEIMVLTQGEGVDVILNSLAGEAINRNFGILKPFGRFLELGKRDFYENTKIGLRPFRNNITYFGIDADQLMCERPALTRKIYAELINLFAEGVLHPLPYHAFEADDIVNAFRYMQQAKQIGKVVVTYRNGISAVHQAEVNNQQVLALSDAGTYLVTGGLSGFGLKTAQWLASKGAKNLVLISRSGTLASEATYAIARLEEQGVRVLAKACDITHKHELATLLEDIRQKLPPLKGIVHAAVVIDDGLVRNLDAEKIRRVLEPKILGAKHLHELTQHDPLDFFVLFSSATTLFGNPGQSSYVAANTWLETLAQQRREDGLPATAVLWGAIDDVGFLARNEKLKDAMQNRMGGTALSANVALNALETMLLENRSGIGVLELDWRALNRFLPTASAPKFSQLASQYSDMEGDDESEVDIHRLLHELPDEQLVLAFVELLRHELGEILRVAPAKIDADSSIHDMGLDSLMGVELIMALEALFGLRLPIMALAESPTLTKLAERIIALLRGKESKESLEHAAANQIQQVVAQHTTEFTPEQMASFSAEILDNMSTKPKRMIGS